MWFITFEAKPSSAGPSADESGGAMVNCYIVRDTLEQARGAALKTILDEGWYITGIDSEYELQREKCTKNSLQYFDQALTDEEVFVFYTWPADAPDASETD